MTDDAPAPSRPQKYSFHARVTGAAMITALVVLVLACATFTGLQWGVSVEQTRTDLAILAEVTASNAADDLAKVNPVGSEEALAALVRAPNILEGRLTDASGRTLATYRKSGTALPAVVRVTVPVLGRTGKMGELSLAARQPLLTDLLPKFLALTGMLLFAGLGTALFLARRLAGGVIEPVQRLSDAMVQVAASGQFRPVPHQNEDPLFRNLTNSFNHLLAKLDTREQALRGTLEDLTVARDAANTANVLKSHFLANMSHEIRTPLNGVLAMAEVMAGADMPRAQKDRLEVIRQSGAQLLAVLNDVLDISKIEAGKLTLIEEDFDLEASLVSTRESYDFLAGQSGLGFSFTITDTARGHWVGDADRLKQILGNLLSNAIKFTHSGSVSVEIDAPDGLHALVLKVSDTGIGIPAEKQTNLFEKFVQVDNSATRRFGGSGLGLAICRELTTMMAGSIEVTSVEGQGASFRVVLPLSRSDAPALQVSGRRPLAADEDRPLRILAAEDNPTNQRVLAAVLEAMEIDLDIVADGRQAYDAWRNGSYDLILMDIQMPIMDGMDAARAIRNLEHHEGRYPTPILALTANALSHQVEEYLAAGMDGHVAKPIEISKLQDAMRRALTPAEPAAGARIAAA
ncbi:MAG: hybrid sensor histidine kinase/response regulator [Alphaproteobacteria bacterium PA2]|nr:MAG: hybrid sensor histidine kinase/response regulator [Alphaproteobacteria bacterium PA2]